MTWALRGIATALALAKAGAHVLVHYGRGAKEAEAVVAEIRGSGGRAESVSADLAAPDGPAKVAVQVRRVNQHGPGQQMFVRQRRIQRRAGNDDQRPVFSAT